MLDAREIIGSFHVPCRGMCPRVFYRVSQTPLHFTISPIGGQLCGVVEQQDWSHWTVEIWADTLRTENAAVSSQYLTGGKPPGFFCKIGRLREHSPFSSVGHSGSQPTLTRDSPVLSLSVAEFWASPEIHNPPQPFNPPASTFKSFHPASLSLTTLS